MNFPENDTLRVNGRIASFKVSGFLAFTKRVMIVVATTIKPASNNTPKNTTIISSNRRFRYIISEFTFIMLIC